MRVGLWSYNYDPEPSGIGPISAVWAREMAARGHEVHAVSAHPHYPEPAWGSCRRPYREQRDGVVVYRLPIWPGRRSAAQRLRQEVSFVLPLLALGPLLPPADVIVAVSPSFPALVAPSVLSALRRRPWVLWLQDILPDGAVATGIMPDGSLIRAARRFERAMYRSARNIVIVSDSFRENLLGKSVDSSKILRIYNPATQGVLSSPRAVGGIDSTAVLSMGNIGHSQNLVAVTEAFEAHSGLEALGATLTMAGDGVAGDEVRRVIRTKRTKVTGVLSPVQLEPLLMSCSVGLVSQGYEGTDFNVPSKLMNFMGYGIPIVAAVRRDSEVAHVVRKSGGGWVAESPAQCAQLLSTVLVNPEERERRGEAGRAFAERNFSPNAFAEQFDRAITAAAA